MPFNFQKMSLVEEYKKNYEIGFPMFEKLFKLKKDDFIKVMRDIFKNDAKVLEILDNKPTVIKNLEDDIPNQISIHFYSSILIDYTGVRYKPEHGCMYPILKFDKFFNFDVALNGI